MVLKFDAPLLATEALSVTRTYLMPVTVFAAALGVPLPELDDDTPPGAITVDVQQDDVNTDVRVSVTIAPGAPLSGHRGAGE